MTVAYSPEELAGFKTVFEQFDYHAPDITKVLTESYEYLLRGRFIGIR